MIFAFYGTPQAVALAINLGYLIYRVHLYQENKWRVDPAKVTSSPSSPPPDTNVASISCLASASRHALRAMLLPYSQL